MTYLILFVSTMLLISVTYAFATQQVNNQKQSFQVVTAQQDMVSLDNEILSLVSQPGSVAALDFRSSGGELNIEPSAHSLSLGISDGLALDATIFNSVTGQVVYKLPAASTAGSDFYLAGDSSTITNQTRASLSQLYIASGFQGPQVKLGFRPAVTYADAGTENGQAVTDVRIYIINLNSSTPLSLQGELPLQISSVNTQMTTHTYLLTQPGDLTVTSQLDGVTDRVIVPVSTAQEGSIINLEIVISHITVEEAAS